MAVISGNSSEADTAQRDSDSIGKGRDSITDMSIDSLLILASISLRTDLLSGISV